MQALRRGEIAPDDPALGEHLDACLGCRGCEPACPSGVEYGQGLEAAREILAGVRGLSLAARALLTLFGNATVRRPVLAAARAWRASGLPARWSGGSRLGFGMGMLAATAPTRPPTRHPDTSAGPPPRESAGPPVRSTVALFTGCVMKGLFDHVHRATRRTLEANGYAVIEPPVQFCCGALHAHAGDPPAPAAWPGRTLPRSLAGPISSR